MKIVIPGGTGQIGLILSRAFSATGDEVVVLSRNPTAHSACRIVQWDGKTHCGWTKELENADVVINLAGRSVNCRYGKENRREIVDSRVDSVRAVGAAIQTAKPPPRVWLQAGTATIYAHRFDGPNDEATGVIDGSEPNAPDTWRFSIDVATQWERALNESPTPNTRKVLMRSAIVMNPDPGSPFSTLLQLVKLGLGGAAGDGRQYMSWIHGQDFANAVLWLINHEELEGPVNLAAPNPLTNSEFMRVLRSAWGMPFGLPATEWMLELGAFVLQSETELILKSRRVVPARLLQSGFTFQFPAWPDAARELCKRARANGAVARP